MTWQFCFCYWSPVYYREIQIKVIIFQIYQYYYNDKGHYQEGEKYMLKTGGINLLNIVILIHMDIKMWYKL